MFRVLFFLKLLRVVLQKVCEFLDLSIPVIEGHLEKGSLVAA